MLPSTALRIIGKPVFNSIEPTVLLAAFPFRKITFSKKTNPFSYICGPNTIITVVHCRWLLNYVMTTVENALFKELSRNKWNQ